MLAYTDTKGNDLTVWQEVTVTGGLVNNNGQDITGTLFTLNGEGIAFDNPIDSDGLSFENTMMTDLSQESLEYTLEFAGGVVNGPSCSVEPLVIEVVNTQVLTIAEIVAREPDLSTLNAALGVAGLVDALDSLSPLTLFGKYILLNRISCAYPLS